MVEVPFLQCPSSAPVPPQETAWRLRAARHSQEEAGPLRAQPPPRVLEPAASKASLTPRPFDDAGKLLEEIVTPAPELTGICIGPEQDALFVTEASTNSVYRIPL